MFDFAIVVISTIDMVRSFLNHEKPTMGSLVLFVYLGHQALNMDVSQLISSLGTGLPFDVSVIRMLRIFRIARPLQFTPATITTTHPCVRMHVDFLFAGPQQT